MNKINSLLEYLGVDTNSDTTKIMLNRRFKHNDVTILKDYAEVKHNDKCFKISLEDLWVTKFRYCRVVSDNFGARYVQLKIFNRRVFLHNLILQPKENYVVDHINGDTLDNTRENLRLVTKQQNCLNRKAYKNSKHKGVSYCKSNKNNPYVARIQVDKQSIYLGAFPTLNQALETRNQAEIQYFGEMRREG